MAVPTYTPLLEALWTLNEPWTALLALDLLPESNGPKVEVFRGSVIVTRACSMRKAERGMGAGVREDVAHA